MLLGTHKERWVRFVVTYALRPVGGRRGYFFAIFLTLSTAFLVRNDVDWWKDALKVLAGYHVGLLFFVIPGCLRATRLLSLVAWLSRVVGAVDLVRERMDKDDPIGLVSEAQAIAPADVRVSVDPKELRESIARAASERFGGDIAQRVRAAPDAVPDDNAMWRLRKVLKELMDELRQHEQSP